MVGSELPDADYPVTFEGKWMKHPTFGDQFRVDRIVNQLPSSRQDIIRFVRKTSSLFTERTADMLVDTIGIKDFWTILRNNPERMAHIEGIGEQRVLSLLNAVKQLTAQDDLQTLFGEDLPLSTSQYRKICSLYEDCDGFLEDEILNDPFFLIHVGYAFKKLDKFAAAHTSIPPHDYRRLLGAAQSILLDVQRSSHVGLPVQLMLNKLQEELRSVAPVNEADCKSFLNRACANHDLVFSAGMFYLNRAHQEETTLSQILSEMAALPPRDIDRKDFDKRMHSYAQTKGFALSPDQQEAVWTALTRQICVITGGPGTGKSTILDAILYCWRIFHTDGDWLQMAPTGKAAVRMTETTGQPSATIHSLLELGLNSGFQEMEDVSAEISQSLIVIDESSMIDLSVASSLVRSLANAKSGTQHLVLVGDPDQLPSVGYGNVLADMISSGTIPVCSLNTIYRQAAGNPIITNSLKMKADDADLVWDNPMFRRYHTGTDANNMESACTLYLRLVKKVGIENVVLLSPFHEKTDISTNALNKKLQDSINPRRGKSTFIRTARGEFRLGDRVMQLRNREWLSNGDVGTITEVNPKADDDEACLSVEFESGIIQGYNWEDIKQLELAYAISVHKSQGSQYKCVLVVLPNDTSSFLTRSILYTAITRAKEYVALFGPVSTIRYMIHNDRKDVRHTRLVPRLQSAAKKKVQANA